MATSAISVPQSAAPMAFFRKMAITMALVNVIGFSFHLAMGRSSFAAPLMVHIHAVIFMGWTALFVTQAMLGTGGRIDVHRRVGMIALFWVPVMMIAGTLVTADVVARGAAPFMFLPQHFLIANPANLLCFAAMFFFAVSMRRRSDWHVRLQLGAMACIMGPAIGRLMPLPFMVPYSYQIPALVCLVVPIAGLIRDWRRDGRVHPAWLVGVAAILAGLILPELIAYSPLGDALYAWITTGQPGETVPGLEFGSFPPAP